MAYRRGAEDAEQDDFFFAVEMTAKKNYSATLLHNSLTLVHRYHYELSPNVPKV
jgi:hypothetical protein